MTQVATAAPAAQAQSQSHQIQKSPIVAMMSDPAVKPANLIKSPAVRDQFTKTYAMIHGIRNQEIAKAFYEAEQFHFLKLINDNKNIAECTKLSLYGIFMDVAVNGLSFDPSMKHLYIVPFSTNVGTREKPNWEKRASLMVSGVGELLLRVKQGQIKYADNPVLVYEGDQFKYGTKNNRTVLEHFVELPRKSDNIIACYIRITRHDDSVDYKVMSMEDINSLRSHSKDPNSTAWTNSLAGMVQAKTIKHAFKSYPKVRVGQFSKMESEHVEETSYSNAPMDYGLGDMQANIPYTDAPVNDSVVDNNAHITDAEVVDENSFAASTPKQNAPTINHDDDNF